MRLKHYIQDEIINESINDKGILHACFMAGMSGSGKSYVISKISDGAIQPKIINTDKMVEFLKAFKNTDWPNIADKVKISTKKQLVLYLNSLLPLWVDGTSSNPSAVMKRNGILKSVGYDTSLIWIDTSLEQAIQRAKSRHEEGGREVIEIEIRKMYKELQGLKSYYASDFQNFTEILNDEDELIDQTILSAYKKMRSFFNSPLKNPIGIKNVNKLKKSGGKYLIDLPKYNMGYLNKLVNNWYIW